MAENLDILNAAVIDALERAMQEHGAPKHIISDQAKVFTGDAFAELLKQWNIKPRFGAVAKHGSIAVTERVIKTLKHEWLKRVAIIKGFDHLTLLCGEFESWYNSWRPHRMLEGLRPDDLYYDRKPEKPKRDSKTVPCNIERHVFQETRRTAYRLKTRRSLVSRISRFLNTDAVYRYLECRPLILSCRPGKHG